MRLPYIQIRSSCFQTLSERSVHPFPAFATTTSNSPLTYNMSSYGSGQISVYTGGDNSSVSTGGDNSYNGDHRPLSPVPPYSQYSHGLSSGSIGAGYSGFSNPNSTVGSQNPSVASGQQGLGMGRGISDEWEARLQQYQNPGNPITNTASFFQQVGKNTFTAADNWRRGYGFTPAPQGGSRQMLYNDNIPRQGATQRR
jgi:hypothetical protein